MKISIPFYYLADENKDLLMAWNEDKLKKRYGLKIDNQEKMNLRFLSFLVVDKKKFLIKVLEENIPYKEEKHESSYTF